MIREATETDLPRCVEMGRHFWRASGYAAIIAENPAQMLAIGERLVSEPNGVLFVADLDGALVGMIGMLIFPHHLSGELTAGELFWWVEPSHRGLGVRLMRRAEVWAVAHGAVAIQMIAPVADASIGRVYERLGYVAIETGYQRRVAT